MCLNEAFNDYIGPKIILIKIFFGNIFFGNIFDKNIFLIQIFFQKYPHSARRQENMGTVRQLGFMEIFI